MLQINDQVAQLPSGLQAEVLHFAEFLAQKNSRSKLPKTLPAKQSANGQAAHFSPKKITSGETVYELIEPLNANVSHAAGQFFIEYEPLNLTVWGSELEEAKAAFNFAFHSLYLFYAAEKDENLTPKARNLKTAILARIKKVKHETPQNERN